jgi:hypothetical protein
MQVYRRAGCVLILAAALLVGCETVSPAAPTPATITQPTTAAPAGPTAGPAAPATAIPGNYPAPATPSGYPPPTP